MTMKIKYQGIAGFAMLSMLLAGCTDSNYDLSDVDTTAEIKVNNLTVPIKLDELTLDQVMDLNDNSEIKKIPDGKGGEFYAVEKEGTFKSSEINVKQFTATPSIGSTSKSLAMSSTPVPAPEGGFKAEYAITGVSPTAFNANATDIDDAIQRIDTIGVNSTLTTLLTMSATGASMDWPKEVKITGLKIKFPIGLQSDHPNFEPSNSAHPGYGLLDLSGETLTPDNSGNVTITMNIIAYATEGNPNFSFDATARTLAISDQVEIQEGTIEMTKTTASLLPTAVNFVINPDMDDLVVSTFTGQVEYNVEDFTIDPIDLSGLPDFLNQDGTKLGLNNPQIYLAMNNPLGNFQDKAQTGYVSLQTDFSMKPWRNGIEGKAYSLDDGPFTIIGGTTDEQEFVMAPTDPEPNYITGFTDPSFVKYTGLKEILKEKYNDVEGIPTKIEVEAVEPKLPSQEIYKFTLGSDLGVVEGRYTFYAPLELDAATVIQYNDTIDGWNDEDVDAMTISQMKIDMTVSTEVPFTIDLELIAIGLNTVPIPGVSSNKVEIPANADSFAFSVTFTGTIQHLDGLLLKARIHDPAAKTLGPQMKMKLEKSKATLTGNYTKEL